jgi:hypothetical protein
MLGEAVGHPTLSPFAFPLVVSQVLVTVESIGVKQDPNQAANQSDYQQSVNGTATAKYRQEVGNLL